MYVRRQTLALFKLQALLKDTKLPHVHITSASLTRVKDKYLKFELLLTQKTNQDN